MPDNTVPPFVVSKATPTEDAKRKFAATPMAIALRDVKDRNGKIVVDGSDARDAFIRRKLNEENNNGSEQQKQEDEFDSRVLVAYSKQVQAAVPFYVAFNKAGRILEKQCLMDPDAAKEKSEQWHRTWLPMTQDRDNIRQDLANIKQELNAQEYQVHTTREKLNGLQRQEKEAILQVKKDEIKRQIKIEEQKLRDLLPELEALNERKAEQRNQLDLIEQKAKQELAAQKRELKAAQEREGQAGWKVIRILHEWESKLVNLLGDAFNPVNW